MNLEELNLEGKKPEYVSYESEKKIEKRKEKKKEKSWFDFLKSKKLQKPDKVAVIYLRNNAVAEPMEVTSKRGFFSIAGKVYHESRDCIYSVVDKATKKRIPLAIIPEWSLIPIGTKRFEDQSMLEKFSELQDHVLRGIRHAELVKMGDKPDKTLTTKQIVLIIIGAIIGIAILMNYI